MCEFATMRKAHARFLFVKHEWFCVYGIGEVMEEILLFCVVGWKERWCGRGRWVGMCRAMYEYCERRIYEGENVPELVL
jgi:hypothetical protein